MTDDAGGPDIDELLAMWEAATARSSPGRGELVGALMSMLRSASATSVVAG